MQEWNDLINGLSQVSSQLCQSITNNDLNRLQTFAKSTRAMSSALKGNVTDQIINQIDAHADYLYWVASQVTQDAQLKSYLHSTLSQLISLLSRVVGSTQYVDRPEGTAWTPYNYFMWRPWGGWWCGPCIYYLLPLINRMQAWLLRRSINKGAVDDATTNYLKYTASQTQFILKATPTEYASLLDNNLITNINTQSQEIVSMAEGIAQDMKLPEGMTPENLGVFDQIKLSIDQMTGQINPALVKSFSELSKIAQNLIAETKNEGKILPGVTYQLKSLVSAGEGLYSSIVEPLSGTLGNSLNSIRENLQSISTTVDSFFAQIGDESLGNIPVQQLDTLSPPLTQLSSTSNTAFGQMNLSPARRDELDAIIITDAMLFAPWIYPVPYRYYGVTVYVDIPTGAIARSPITRKVTSDVTRSLGKVGGDLGKGLDKVGKDLGKGLDKVGKDLGKGLGGIGKGFGGIGK
ncbi:MAG: hypothetical protein ACFFCD_11205, partial [Promethearchaeota archaeon]